MNENNAPVVNLLETTTFTRTVHCSLPGNGVDVRRPFQFKATFELIDQDEWEELVDDANKSVALSHVLRSVEGVPSSTLEDGTVLSPVEVVIKNPITCDAAFTSYWLYTSDDGRKAAQAAGNAKNSKRSRKR